MSDRPRLWHRTFGKVKCHLSRCAICADTDWPTAAWVQPSTRTAEPLPAPLDMEALLTLNRLARSGRRTRMDEDRIAAAFAHLRLRLSQKALGEEEWLAAAPAGLAVALHDYLHNEGVWSAQREDDEDEDWHWRVCEGAARLLASVSGEAEVGKRDDS